MQSVIASPGKEPVRALAEHTLMDSEQIEILDFPIIVDSIQDGKAPEFTPFFLVENVLGIPKKALVRAYLSAREEFMSIVNDSTLNLAELNSNSLIPQRLRELTKVMILFDSEHQTAVNYRHPPTSSLLKNRKRLIRTNHISPEIELQFPNVLFTSPLPRHVKSPILWTHRRFLISLLPPTSLPSLHDEMAIIFTAADRHPKNYHAWTYARFIWLHLQDEATWSLPQLSERIRTWCISNISDHSGWMFYIWLLGAQRPWGKRLREVQRPVEIVRRVIGISENIAPGHEALWAFVRGCVVGMEGVLDADEKEVVLGEIEGYERRLNDGKHLTAGMERDRKAITRLSRFTGRSQAAS